MRLPHICFLAPEIYPVLAPSPKVASAGGAEVQQVVIGRALARAGYHVSMLSKNYGQGAKVSIDGLDVYRLPTGGRRGIKGLRFVHPRLTDAFSLLDRIGPDIVYVRAASAYVAAAAAYARLRRRKLVYAAAHDDDFRIGRQAIPKSHDGVLFRLGLRRADGVLVQNVVQKELLRAHYGLSAEIIPNAYVEPGALPADVAGPVVWVGSVKPVKRPDLFLDLAAGLPQQRFVMAGGPGVGKDAVAYFADIEARAREVPNVEFLGFVPFDQVGRVFDGAAALVNTSDSEGFPNTFLQAWVRGVPTFSFVAPEIERGETGTHACADLDELTNVLRAVIGDATAWQAASAQALDHFKKRHSLEGALERYNAFFKRLTRF